MLRAVLLIAFAAVTLAVPEIHHFVLNTDSFDVHQDIIADVEENYAILIVGTIDGCKYCNSTVNFHDFNTGMLAIKEVATEICYISKSPIPAMDIDMYRSKHSKIRFNYTAQVHGPNLSFDEVSLMAGKKIADFCKEYIVIPVELTHLEKQIRETDETPLSRSNRAMFCLICSFKAPTLVENRPQMFLDRIEINNTIPVMEAKDRFDGLKN